MSPILESENTEENTENFTFETCFVATRNIKSIFMPPPPPLEKGGHIASHLSVRRSVGMSVSFNLVQLITQERFVPEASNLVQQCR